jgi:hypothetical protein
MIRATNKYHPTIHSRNHSPPPSADPHAGSSLIAAAITLWRRSHAAPTPQFARRLLPPTQLPSSTFRAASTPSSHVARRLHLCRTASGARPGGHRGVLTC